MKKHSNITNKNPFTLPDDYFNTFTDKVMDQIKKKQEKEVRVVPLFRRVRPYMALAAMITAFALITTVVLKVVLPQTEPIGDLASSEIQWFDESMISNIDLLMIEGVVLDQESDLALPEVDKEAIIDYLVSNDITLNTIYELL